MPKKAKIGKQRRDKYYHLAKETGYRSRAAFKLIQLERKFDFLKKSRVCIDLCAAPGGWMQVAHENMPVSSVVIGVDLFPIKAVPGCISFIGDITTDKCKTDLSRELKTWKADVVLNDGAPNVGQNWLLDAYQQSTLTLSALKLATQFLRKGGCFVTKVFRSKDYTALLFNLKQLFKKVHATKPQASRNESAEIFVVCQGYLAPPKVDPKLLDPKYVFADEDKEVQNKLNVFNPEKQKKAKALGYADNDHTLYHKVSVKDYIASNSAIETLEHASEIFIDDERILNHPKTTKEVKECCKDIKVLGKRELKLLMNWYKAMKQEFDKKQSEVIDNDDKLEESQPKTLEEIEDMEDEQITKDIEHLKEQEAREKKRKKKKANREANKLHQKMNLNMVVKGDAPIMECDDMFSLNQIKSQKELKQVSDQSPDVLAESDSEEDETVKRKTVRYEKGTGCLDSKGLYYKDEESELEFEEDDDDDETSSNKAGSDLDLGDSDDDNDIKKMTNHDASDDNEDAESESLSENDEEENEDEEEDEDEGEDDDDEEKSKKKVLNPVPKKKKLAGSGNPLLTDLDYRNKSTKQLAKVNMFYERDGFQDFKDEDLIEDLEIDKMVEVYKKKGGKIMSDKTANNLEKKEDNDDSDYDSDYNVNDFITHETKSKQNSNKTDSKVLPKNTSGKSSVKKRKLTTEDLALGSMLALSKKSRRDVIDGAWNRFAFNDDNLPSWFIEDEKKNMKKDIPVTKELAEEYKKRVEDINVRPIKKVMEAKARKKKRAMRKMDSAKKRVENVMDNVELSDREKARQVKSIYKKATKEPKKEVTYVVAKKHSAQKRAVRPQGVKGQYKVVDPRMKKDLRAQKAKEKTKGRGKKGGGGKRQRQNSRGKRAR